MADPTFTPPIGSAVGAQRRFNEWYESLPPDQKVEKLQGELPPPVLAAIKMFGNRGYLEGYLQALKDYRV